MHRHRWKKPKEGDIFKFCGCGKRKKAAKSVRLVRRGLQRKAEDLWRKIAHLRDGKECQVKKVFPELNLRHSNEVQVDHFFPRADRNLYFEPSNATVLCSTCNYLKSNGSPQSTIIQMAVKDIVLRREGKERFDWMFDLNNRRPLNLEWGREFWLRGQIIRLEEIMNSMNKSIGDGF